MSKMEVAAELVKDVDSFADVAEEFLDKLSERSEMVRKLFALFVNTLDTIHTASLNHEGYYTNLAKSRYAFFKALTDEGFTDDQAMLLMVDNELKMAKMKDRIERGTGGDKK